MTSTTFSSPNKQAARPLWQIYAWTLKRHKSIAVLFAVLFCLALPMALGLALLALPREVYNEELVQLFNLMFEAVVIPLSMLLTLVVACVAFQYMHTKRSVDLYYALPVSRTTLFLGRYLGGLTLCLLPGFGVWVVTSLLFSTRIFSENTLIWQDLLVFFVAVASTYTFSVLCAMCSGTLFDTLVSILAVNVVYPVTVLVLSSFAAATVPGSVMLGGISSLLMTALSPYGAVIVPLTARDYLTGYVVYWLVVTLLMLAAAFVLNKRRKVETAETSFAFRGPSIFIRFMASLTSGVGLGWIFQIVTQGSVVMFVLGALIGSFVAHLVLELLYTRSFRFLKKSLWYYAAATACVLILYACLMTGLFGYETRVPDAGQVESAEIWGSVFEDEWEGGTPPVVLTERENVERVIQLHQLSIESDRQAKKRSGSLENTVGMATRSYAMGWVVRYTLEDGSVMERSYLNSGMPVDGDIQQLCAQIADSGEYIRKQNQFLFDRPEDEIQMISIGYASTGEDYLDVSAADRHSLLEALKADLLQDTTEQRQAYYDEQMSSETGYDPLSLTVEWQGSTQGAHGMLLSDMESYVIPDYYENTLRFLQQHELMPSRDQATAEDTIVY